MHAYIHIAFSILFESELQTSCTSVQFSLVQALSRIQLFATPRIAACQASLFITNSWSLLKLMPIESVMPSSHLILCHPLLLLPPIPPSIRIFSNKSTLLIRWPRYWSFIFSTSPSKEHPGLISFKMDLLDLLAVQGTLKSLLQHHSSKASIFRHSAFFIVQLSHPYMATGRTRRTFVGKVTSLLFNMLSRFVITFLPRSKHLLISWLQSPSAVILEPPQKILTLFPLSPHLFPMRWWDQMPWSYPVQICWRFHLGNVNVLRDFEERSCLCLFLNRIQFNPTPHSFARTSLLCFYMSRA